MAENKASGANGTKRHYAGKRITRNAVRGYVVLGIVFVAVSAAAFIAPIEKNAAFWVSYAFTVAALAAQVFIWRAGLAPGVESNQAAPLKSKFLGLPLVHVGVVYAVLQLIVLAVFAVAPGLPLWSAVLACVVLAAVAGVCLVGVDAAREEIERVDQKVECKVSCLKTLQAEVELLAQSETDAHAREALSDLVQKIRFSDPMSSDQLAELEGEITGKVDELKASGSALSPEQKLDAIADISQLIDERNVKCKILK